MTPEERSSYLLQFLNLPVRDIAPTGLCKSDVYLSIRDMAFDLKPRPVLANIINPYARYCFDPIPVAMYKNFVTLTAENVSIAFRPSVIMVDDPVLASFLLQEIPVGCGTEIRYVDVKTTTLTNIDGITCNLQEAANSVWAIIRKEIQKLVTKQTQDASEKDKVLPIVLSACQNSTCGKLDNSHKSCSNCMNALYCSAACQKSGWKKHKKNCIKK